MAGKMAHYSTIIGRHLECAIQPELVVKLEFVHYGSRMYTTVTHVGTPSVDVHYGDTRGAPSVDVHYGDTRGAPSVDVHYGDTRGAPSVDVHYGDTRGAPSVDVHYGDTRGDPLSGCTLR